MATNGPVLSTADTFTISAWVNLTATGNWSTAVSQDGNEVSGFYLQYDLVDNAWAFSRAASETANASGTPEHRRRKPGRTWSECSTPLPTGPGPRLARYAVLPANLLLELFDPTSVCAAGASVTVRAASVAAWPAARAALAANIPSMGRIAEHA